ncbi:MAG TPA: pitrilysin family protein [Bryobacteraceae bacterium]|jgi:predicted Zn-dependent peptidase|nr:pitrilysin family protein [Bryobacteraceae bacterium]
MTSPNAFPTSGPFSQDREIGATTLPNGVRVITERMPHVRSVSMGVWIGTGSRHERSEENGISHFIEHMVFKGTKHRSAEQIARSVDSIGGGLDAFTAKEMVSYNTKVLDEHMPIAFDVLADLVLNPLFREQDIEKEKGVILEELKMEVDNPEYLLTDIFFSNFWKDHSIGWPILGTKDTIRNFRRDMLHEYYSKIYQPSNILITAAGNLTHQQMVELAGDRFSALPSMAPVEEDPKPVPHARLAFRNKASLEQTHLYLGVPCHPLPHEDRFVCYALNTVLGGGMSSRLFQNIREKQGLAYAVFSELSMYRDTGCMAIYAGTAMETARQVVELIMKELREIKENPISEEELRRAKDHMKGSFMLGLESTSSRMGNLARQELYYRRFFSLDEMLASIESVTAAQVQKLAQEFFHPKNITLAMLGNLGDFRLRRDELVC